MNNKNSSLENNGKKMDPVHTFTTFFSFLFFFSLILSTSVFANSQNSVLSINDHFGFHEIIAQEGYMLKIFEGSSTYDYQVSSRPLYYRSQSGLFTISLYDESGLLIEQKEVGFDIDNEVDSIVIVDNSAISEEHENISDIEFNQNETVVESAASNRRQNQLNLSIRGRNKVDFELMVKSSGVDEGFRSQNIATLSGNKADIIIRPQGMSVKEIRMNKLSINNTIDLGFEPLLNNFRIYNETIIDSFAMDPSELEFDEGEFSFVAVGTKLWKCEGWDFDSQSCYSEWVHVMDTVPGETYNVGFDAVDPGYAQTGVSTINTGKSSYLLNESAEMFIVVLDSRGYPVNNAYVELTITAPSGQNFSYNTNDDIYSETRGIYEIRFNNTLEIGTYQIEVKATGLLTDTIFYSSFEVKESILFDIIRTAPIIIDPWTGSYESRIRIISNDNLANFSFYDRVPIDFILSDVQDAVLVQDAQGTLLGWHNLNSGDEISYKFNAPLVSPAVHQLGISYVLYENNTDWIQYAESRPWFIASDPAVYYDPTTTVSAGWDSGTGTTFAEIDDGIRQPTVPNTADYVADQLDGVISEFGFSNITQSGVTSITLWVYTGTGTNAQYTFSMRQGAAVETCNTPVASNSATQWRSCTWATPSGDLSDMRVRLGGVTRNGGGAPQSAFVYAAYLEVNYDEPPNVSLNVPANNSVYENSTVSFNFSVIDDTSSTVSSCSLYTNFSGSFLLNTTITSVPNGTSSTINVSNVQDGTWLWNVFCTDSVGNSAFAPQNFTVRVNNLTPSLISPSFNESLIRQGRFVNFSVNITDLWGVDYAEAQIRIPNGTILTLPLENSGNIYWSLFNDTIITGIYNLTSIFANDTLGKPINQTYSNLFFEVESVLPEPFNLLAPENNTISSNLTPYLDWEDTQTINFSNYTIQFSPSNDFFSVSFSFNTLQIEASNYSLTTNLTTDTLFYWRVIAYDIFGNSRISNQYFTYRTDNTAPFVELNSPENMNYQIESLTVFNATGTDSNGLSSCNLYTNSTGSWHLNQTNSSVVSGVPVLFSVLLPEGPLLWNVECIDIASNSGFSSINRTLIVDLSAPLVTQLDPLNNSLINNTNTIEFNVSAFDLYSDLDSCSIIVNGTVRDTISSLTNDVPFSFLIFLLNEHYVWQVNCTDIHGFEGFSDTQFIDVLVVDSDPPLITLNSPLNNSHTNNNNLVFQYTPEDATGIDSCSLYLNNTLNQTNNSINNLVQNQFNINSMLDSSYSWKVECTDSTPEQNIGISDNNMFRVDTINPVVSLNAPINDTFRNSLTINFNATVADINISHCSLYTNTTGSWAYNANNTNIQSGTIFIINNALNESTILWNIACYDRAGNSAFANENRTVKIDVTPPSFSSPNNEPSSPTTYNPALNVYFNISVNDSFSGVSFVEFEHNAYGGFQIFNATNLGGGVYRANLTGLIAQSFSYRWRSRDIATNYNSSVYSTYTVNKATPNLNLLFNGSQSNISVVELESVNITANMSAPPGQIISLYINSNLVSEKTSPNYFAFNSEIPGIYNVTAIVNESQNYTALQTSLNITVNDINAPIITLLFPENNSFIGVSPVFFSYNVSDYSSIANCSLIINGSTIQTDTTVDKDITQFFSQALSSEYYNWNLVCYDSVGNQRISELRYFNLQESTQVNIIVSSDKILYEQGEIINISLETFDDFMNPANASVRTDVFTGIGTRPWWNGSYSSRYAIIVNETTSSNIINGIIDVNLSGLSNTISDCRHIRVISHQDSIMSPTEFGVFEGDNSTWCQVLFRANVTANAINDDTYYVYYNTSTPSVASNLISVRGWQNYFAAVAAADEGTPTNVANIIGNNDATAATMSQGGGAGTHSAHGRGFITGLAVGTVLDVQARFRYAVPSTCGACTWQLRNSVNDGVAYTISLSGATTTGLSTSSWFSLTSSYAALNWTEVNRTRLQGRMVKTGGGGTGTLNLHWVELNITYKITSDINQSDLGSVQRFIIQNSNYTGGLGINGFNIASLTLELGNYSAVGIASQNDLANGTNFTSFELIADLNDPNVTLIYPENNSLHYDQTMNFTFEPSDLNLDTCSLYINNVYANLTNSPISNQNNTLVLELGFGNYNWTIECNDTSENVGISDRNQFTIADSIIVVEDVLLTDPIMLTAANTTTVYCNATVYGSANSHVAYLYADTYLPEDSDNGFYHYTNSSCDFNSNLFSCSFEMQYYALNGSWTCMFSATNFAGSDNLTNTTIVEPLIALGVNESVIDYLNVSSAALSEIVEVEIFNYGNQPMDLRLYGYGAIENDGKLLDCPTDFIPESYQRFSINSIEAFDTMTNLSANSTQPNVIALNLPTGASSSVSSYWRLQVPQLFEESQCQGSVVFVATLSS